MRTFRASLFTVTLALSLAACGDKEAEAKRQAEIAAKSAKEADEAAAKAAADAKAQAESAAKAKLEVRGKLQKDLDGADRKIAYLKEKVTKATAPKKKNADAALAEVEARRTSAVAAIAKLDGAVGPLDTVKTGAESDLAALTKAIDNLETTLK